MVAADEPRNSFDLVRFEGHHDPEIGGIGRAATLDAKVARKDELRRQKEAPIAFHRLEHGKRQKGRRSPIRMLFASIPVELGCPRHLLTPSCSSVSPPSPFSLLLECWTRDDDIEVRGANEIKIRLRMISTLEGSAPSCSSGSINPKIFLFLSWRFADVLTVGDLFRRAMSHWRTNLGPLELEAALRILNTVRSVYLFIFRMLVFGAASAYG
ncbi:hypothetical protein GW17_00003500 [Ensete ventricosum]|nr:hypothetical protein GW17_00003500 [Ensete ventricosum]